MDRIKQQIEHVRQQLAGLTASQKMLVGTLVAVSAVTIAWWVGQAANGDTVALLEQPMTPDQIGEVRRHLAAGGIEFEVVGDAVHVEESRRSEALALLSYERALPADTTKHFDAALGTIGSFDSLKKTDLTILNARQNTLAAAMRGWPGVRHVTVSVSDEYRRQMGQDLMPKASVSMTLNGGADARKLAESAAQLVSGAFQRLDPSAVKVIANGSLVRLDDEEAGGIGGKVLDLRRENERYHADRLLSHFSYIPGLSVTVTVDVNDRVTRTTENRLDPDTKVSLAIETETEADVVEDGDPFAGGEAGFNANVGLSAAGGGGGGSSKTADRERTRNVVDYARTHEVSYREAGKGRPVGCSMSVPLSWVRGEWQRRTGSDAPPALADLRDYESERLANLAQTVGGMLDGIDPAKIHVVSYADADFSLTGPITLAADAAADDGPSMIGTLARDHGRTAAVVALAGVALFLVTSLAKKGVTIGGGATTSVALATDTDAYADAMRLLGEAPPVEARSPEAMMIGREVADEQIQAGQMVEQVQTLVKENPDAAAALVKRWLNAG